MGDHSKLSPALGLILSGLISVCAAEKSVEADSSNTVMIEVPAAAESMSPNLAVGPDGTVVLSWLELSGPDSALKFTQLSDDNWIAARSIAHGDNWFVNWADFPSVVPVSPSLWVAHWLISQPAGGYAYDVLISLSTDAGRHWSEPVMPHRDGTATEHGFVTLYPNEAGVGLVWLDGRNMANEDIDRNVDSGMTLRAASLSPDLVLSNEMLIDGLICDCCQTDVAITAEGPVAVYRDRTTAEIRDVHVSRYVGDRWQEGKPVGNDNWEIPACPVNGPVIDASENTVVAAWFTGANDVPRVKFGFSDDSAASFSTPVDVVSEETLGRVGLAILPDGDAAVSWLRKASIHSAELCIRRVSVDGHLGPVNVISGNDDIPSFSVPKMVRKGNDLIVAWTRRIDGASRITTARVPISSL